MSDEIIVQLSLTSEVVEIENYNIISAQRKAAVAVFGKSYEYTRKYREFFKMMKAKEKENKDQLRLM